MEVNDRKVYVASSWRNPIQIAVVAGLRSTGMEVYDFRNPFPSNKGFHWSEVGLEDPCDQRDYLKAIEHPISIEGFKNDFEAMEWANTFVLVLPCGRSAHLELGWAVGAKKETFILLDSPVTPELMYKMVDGISDSLFDLLGMLGVKD